MRMFQRRARSLAVILENQNVLESPVLLQIKNAVAESPEHVFDSLGRKRGQARLMVGSFDDDLVRPNPVHAIEHALGLAVEAALNAEGWKFVGNHSHRPSRGIALRCRPSVRVRTVRLNLGWRLALIPVTERTKSTLQFHSVTGKVGWTFGAVRRNNYPSTDNWIFSKLGQRLNPFNNGI